MSACVFCLMRLQGTPHLKQPEVTLTLTADSMRQPYFVVAVPTCQAHASIPGVLDRVMEGAPAEPGEGKTCYDESVKLFEKEVADG